MAGRKRKADNTETEPATKRPRRGRNRRGILANMPDMPLDILYEIIRYLMPADLLNLARTNKLFRQFLMARSAAPLWKAARMNVEGMPGLPAHLSEPAYANLAFDTHCHSCYKPNVKTVFWALGVRYCPDCRKSMLFKCPFPVLSSQMVVTMCGEPFAPYTNDNKSSHHWHLSSDISNGSRLKFLDMDEESKETHRKRILAIIEFARLCENWSYDMACNREAELKDLRAQRLQCIVEKLKGLGWGEELDLMAPCYTRLGQHSSVNQARPLTDRTWNNIRGEIVAYMQVLKTRREEEEWQHTLRERCTWFARAYRKWYAKQKDKCILPRAIDLMRRPEVKALAERATYLWTNEDDFIALSDQFAEWAAEWKAECDEKLRELVRSSPAFKDQIPEGVDPLSLASVIFTCEDCKYERTSPKNARLPSPYPAILAHECLYKHAWDFDFKDPFERATVSVSLTKDTFNSHTFWSCEPLEVGIWHKRASEIIKMFGKDPMTTTREEMDNNVEMRLHCDQCSKTVPRRREVMTWRQALRHYAVHDALNKLPAAIDYTPILEKIKYPVIWRAMSGADLMKVVLPLEATANAIIEDQHEQLFFGNYYNCCHCARGALSPIGILEHLDTYHNINGPDEDDFYRSPDAEMSIIRPTLLLHPDRDDVELADELQTKAEYFKYEF